MLIGNINTIPSIVNLPGQGIAQDQGAAYRFQRNTGGWFEATSNNSNLGVIKNINISCWVKIDQEFFDPVTSNTDYHILDKFLNSQRGGYKLFLRNFSNGNKQLKFTGVQTGVGSAEISLDISSLQANTAYLITVSCSGFSTAEMRVKGVGVSLLQTQPSFVNPTPTASFPVFLIGNVNPTSSNQGFAGVIDEVALWPDTPDGAIDETGANNLFNWPVYKDLMNSNPLGNNLQPRNWFRMGENATQDASGIIIPNEGSFNQSQTLISDGSPLPQKVAGIPNELYN